MTRKTFKLSYNITYIVCVFPKSNDTSTILTANIYTIFKRNYLIRAKWLPPAKVIRRLGLRNDRSLTLAEIILFLTLEESVNCLFIQQRIHLRSTFKNSYLKGKYHFILC